LPTARQNRAGGDCADANGNILLVGSGCSFLSAYSYDVENRIIFSGVGTVPTVEYAYAPDNKRVWRGVFSSGTRTVDEVTFWSVTGQRVGIYNLVPYSGSLWPVTAPANPGKAGKAGTGEPLSVSAASPSLNECGSGTAEVAGEEDALAGMERGVAVDDGEVDFLPG
jgi:hypothetical protein